MAINPQQFAAAMVPPDNVVSANLVKLWDLGQKCWIERPSVDAREIVATGSGAWCEPEPEPAPQPPEPDAKKGKKADKADPPVP